ncbi:MAG: TolB family protein [Luteolibacter sp.]
MDISADGDLVLFKAGEGTESVPGLAFTGLYLRTISTGLLEFAGATSITNSGINAAQISDDGRYVTWATTEDHHIYWRDRQTGQTRWITENHGGINVYHAFPKITADGRYVAFASNSPTLISDSSKRPATGFPGVYLYDSQNQSFQIISLTSSGQQISTIGRQADVASEFSTGSIASYASFDITPDGKYVVFSTDYILAHPDRQSVMFAGYPAILRRNIANGSTVLVNRNAVGTVSNGAFRFPRISADGNRVVFQGQEVGITAGGVSTTKMVAFVPYNVNRDLYVKDIDSQAVFFLTPSITGFPHSGTLGNDARISDDGMVVAFSSDSSTLIGGNDSSGGGDVFRADLSTLVTASLTLITKSPDSFDNVAFTDGPMLSGDGKYITFGTNQFSAMGFSGASANSHGIGVGELPEAGEVGGNSGAFDAWALDLPEGMRGANDNPSGDGVPNLLKYFIGSDATVPDLRFLPELQKATSIFGIPTDTNEYLTLTVRVKRNLPEGYIWQVQSADTLDRLITVPAPTFLISGPIADGEYDVYTYASFTPIIASRPTGFMWLKVSFP